MEEVAVGLEGARAEPRLEGALRGIFASVVVVEEGWRRVGDRRWKSLARRSDKSDWGLEWEIVF